MSGASVPCIVKEVGVDYITATSHQVDSSSGLVSFGRWLVSEEAQRGCKASPFRATGYHGSHAGGCAFGVSHQGGIVKLSGESARDNWAQCLNLADNVTRLDLQVTVRPNAGVTSTLSRHHKELLRAPRSRGKPAKFKAFYGPAGIEGVHIGRRVSDRFGRAYDKGLESGLQEYEGTLRYELEVHRELALRTALQLDSQELDQDFMLAQVHRFMSIRGLKGLGWRPLPPQPADSRNSLTGYNRSIVTSSSGLRPEVVRALRWLANSVQPSITRLIETGYSEQVFAALGLSSADADHATRRVAVVQRITKRR